MKKTIETPGMLLPEVDDATRREFLIGAAGLLLLPAACGGQQDGGDSPSGETRTVEHQLGTTEVPVNPQRIVALDSAIIPDGLLALDEKPVGAIPSTGGGVPHLAGGGDARRGERGRQRRAES
jgi:ABC-type Fe3+-hydroxamate transport system substrate-binding protein